ncbi:hypothetical protein [Segniliparus rugosus]|nr:hypothetical protein [Segniliparus rugosus]
MRLSRNSLSGGGSAHRWARRGLLAALAFGAPLLTGCAVPALFVAANVADSADGGSAGADGAGGRWRGYLPKAEDFPGDWDVSAEEVLRVGPAGSASPVENLKLVFGAPPQGCALPESLYKVKDHPSVTGTKAPDPGRSDIVSKTLATDIHAVTVEVGPIPEKDSLIATIRGLPEHCGSFQFAKNSSYDSDFQVEGSIKQADPKLGFGEAAGLTFTFAPKISTMYGSSSSSGLGQDLGFAETVYAARIKGVSVVAVSFSFKDPAADAALVLKLFQETAKRMNA